MEKRPNAPEQYCQFNHWTQFFFSETHYADAKYIPISRPALYDGDCSDFLIQVPFEYVELSRTCTARLLQNVPNFYPVCAVLNNKKRLSDETLGLWLGLLGVTIFAATLPVTRLAVGPVEDPQLDPVFVASGRAAIAGILSVLYLWFTHARKPSPQHWSILAVCALGTAVAFPVFLSMALRYTESTHAAVVSGLIPLVTAISAALYFRQRPSTGFWICALTGCGLVIAFALYKGSGHFSYSDGLLLLAVISTSVGYVAGARVSSDLPPAHVICWVMVITLPLSVPVAWLTWPHNPIRWESWLSLGYVSVFSMWLGFFAWYRGMVLGGAVRVSQVQLIQPFLALIFSVPIVGERLDLVTVFFSIAVIATVLLSKKMPAGRPAR